jgi:hypothetical protein
MSQNMSFATGPIAGDFFVPGTCVTTGVPVAAKGESAQDRRPRDPVLRNYYLDRAMAAVPRLLGAMDRNPYRPTYGCLDRQYWHYRTSAFPSEMYQEGVLPLALVYVTPLPGNRWLGGDRLRELVTAGIRFAARSSHPDGSCDDYYPYERALGAAVFSLQATAHAYQLLELNDPKLVRWFERRARWLMTHDESGHLANHQAMAALGLLRVAAITGDEVYRKGAEAKIDTLLRWQCDEGWFEEYGGADPGYQTVSIDCLAKIRRLIGGDDRLDEPLRRAVAFARLFLHPDHSFAGEYGSRGTYHFYPHGMELLIHDNPAAAADAAELADGFLRSLASGTEAHFGDDRMFAHQLTGLIEAYRDWSPHRPAIAPGGTGVSPVSEETSPDETPIRYFPRARLLVRRAGSEHTVISAARGGVFKHFSRLGPPVSDAGLIVETTDGRLAVSQQHDPTRRIECSAEDRPDCLRVAGLLHWCRFETASPLKQTLLHAGMCTAGRMCRTLVRRMLQRRLITGRRPCPIWLTRSFEFLGEQETRDGPTLRVTDTIELTRPRVRVRRMSLGTDHESAYVAASGVYQQAVLAPWTDLAEYVEKLNTERRVTIVREW